MGKIKNKIITISGEPVTGKGTNVKRINEKLIERGYKPENIHIVTTGHEFRRYFELVMELIKNIKNEDVLKQLKEKEELKAIFDNKVYREKFIKELSKIKKNKGDSLKEFSIEQANNIPELSGIREIVDTVIDENVKKMGMDINSVERPDEVWIIDSRLAFSNIPDSFSVRLTCRPDIAGKRLFEDNSRGKEDSQYKSVEEAIDQREKRRLGEIKRYKERYDIDLSDENNYNMIIDTSFSTVEDISDAILNCLDRYQEDKFVPKKWTSPKMLLAAQSVRDTGDISEVLTSIKENGFNPVFYIDVIAVKDLLFINDGHHRNFGALYAGKTLVPYSILAKDEEIVPGSRKQARDFIPYNITYIYDHYNNADEIYPNLFERINELNKEREERKSKNR